MPSLQIRAVSSRLDERQFLEFPFELYAQNSRWVPPLRMEERQLAGFGRHPFHERNASQAFLACRGSEVVGRILAIDNLDHGAHHNDGRGFFGFFECRDDADAARGLIDAASEWGAARGLTSLRGPFSPSINYQAGVMVDGHDTDPTFLTPYNPPYYGRLLEDCGFAKSQDLYAFTSQREELPDILARGARVTERLVKRRGLRYRTLRRSRFKQDLTEFLSVINQSLVDHWGYVPLAQSELEHVARGLYWLLVPELVVGVEIDGRLAGVAIALPDYNPRVREIGGRLFPFGFVRLLTQKRNVRRLRVVAANVLPEYNRIGLGVALIKGIMPRVLEWGADELEYSWIAESNAASRGTIENTGALRARTYRVYDRAA